MGQRRKKLYKSEQDRKAVTGGNSNIPNQITVQHGVGGGEHSQWEIAEVAMWKQRLTDAQCEELADYYTTDMVSPRMVAPPAKRGH